jgi:tetratricopeptide (TPR) repeat protein
MTPEALLDRGHAQLLADPSMAAPQRAALLGTLGSLYVNLGQPEKATAVLGEALQHTAAEAVADRAEWLQQRGQAHEQRQRYADAQSDYLQAIALLRAQGDPGVLGDGLASLGLIQSRLDLNDQAEASLREAMPEYFPVLVAAFEAMNQEGFNFHGSTASTGGSAPLLIVSGPYAEAIGMNADVNLFGPGNRANATIGRAVRLILRNVFQMLPGISDKSTQGNPGKYSFCIAERARGNPWPLLCETQGYPEGVSSITVFAGGGFCNVENHGGNTPEQVLGSVADAMANYGCITLGQSVVVLSPEHMQIVAAAGWTRSRAQDFLFTQAKRSVDGMKSVGKYRDSEYAKQHAPDAHALVESGYVHRGLKPEDILITLGGGDAGGHSCFIPSWSRGRGSIMQHKPIRVRKDRN